MDGRKLEQYGWISGPVDCGCSMCSWGASFEATDTSVPDQIMEDFRSHNCGDYLIRATPAQHSWI
jgi:hypothetical protein